MKRWITGVVSVVVLLGSGWATAADWPGVGAARAGASAEHEVRGAEGRGEGRGAPQAQAQGRAAEARAPEREARAPERESRAPAQFRGPARVERDGRGMVLDSRYDHGQYYPPRGYVYRTLPSGYRPYYYGGRRLYFNAGVWYEPGPLGFIVTRPPIGLSISVLPPYYSTVWFGGVPYYYADDVYYTWRPAVNGYVVTDPPADADNPGGAAPPPADDFFVYPKSGQTEAQQSADRYECHSWAKNQTGFDPTEPGGGVAPGDNAGKRADYRRAMTACLEARGYSVK